MRIRRRLVRETCTYFIAGTSLIPESNLGSYRISIPLSANPPAISLFSIHRETAAFIEHPAQEKLRLGANRLRHPWNPSQTGECFQGDDVLRDLAPEAFTESKRMRTGHFCADVREQLSARVARQVEIWHSAEAQTRLHAAAKRLAR